MSKDRLKLAVALRRKKKRKNKKEKKKDEEVGEKGKRFVRDSDIMAVKYHPVLRHFIVIFCDAVDSDDLMVINGPDYAVFFLLRHRLCS